jgi:GT2 family glycosyltransferase
MLLDIVVPTYTRPLLLRRTLGSLFAATRPETLSVHVTVVDNDPALSGLNAIGDLVARAPVPVTLLGEHRPGKSHALNTGIRNSSGAYVGFIDDDEEVHPRWFEVVATAIAERQPDFLGGPTSPRWPARVPRWLPRDYPAVLGIVDNGIAVQRFGDDCEGMLTGGNAVIARAMFDRVGLFSPLLGPRRDRRLFSSEDEDMFWRLIDAGGRGWYLPQMVVYHHIHRERLSKRYYRTWCFWNGVSKAVLARSRTPDVPTVAGVPRYVYGRAVRGACATVWRWIGRRPPSRRFSAELAVWELAGQLYGRHGYRDGWAGRQSDAPASEAADVRAVVAG